MWGTIFLVVGAIPLLTAFLIFRVRSVIILVVDGVVIYALTVYGDVLRPAR
jgi:hypothetical protein